MKYKLFVFALTALSLIVTAEAKKGGNNAAQRARIQQEQKKKAAEKAERDKKREAVDGVLKDKDKNDDGSLTRDEYIAGEANADEAGKRFDQFNKNKDRYLSRQEIETMLGL